MGEKTALHGGQEVGGTPAAAALPLGPAVSQENPPGAVSTAEKSGQTCRVLGWPGVELQRAAAAPVLSVTGMGFFLDVIIFHCSLFRTGSKRRLQRQVR